MKRDSKTALTRFPLENEKIQSVVVKQYKVGCMVCLIKNIFRGSAGRKAWIAGNGLLVYGLNTPEPLALMEKKVLGITTSSYLIMEDARDCLEMDRYILKDFHDKLSLSRLKKKRALINNLAETMGRMHNLNIFHHDLKTCNIMVKEKDKSSYITFLDFDKVSFEEEITIQKRVKNLTQMNLSTPKLISTTDRLRFLKEYREIINLSKTEKILYVSSNGDVTEDW
jgi:tRNA A-37 threonylcarbamoyl transferase component Bud32